MTAPLGAVVLIDGRLKARGKETVSVFDRGFLFGDAVFEVLRTYGGAPFGMSEHIERLGRSMAMFGIDASLETLPAEIHRAVARARKLGADDVYVRIVVSRGVGPLHLDPAPARAPRRVVIAAPLLPLPPALDAGVAMATVLAHRAADATSAAAAKASAYVGNMLAFVTAKERGAYEALLTTESGVILEGHSSSFFIVRGGTIETPPLSMGILPGITRAMVQRLASDAEIPFVERIVLPSDVYRADEAFLASSLREVVPVTTVDGVRIGGGEPGPITKRLRLSYRALVTAT